MEIAEFRQEVVPEEEVVDLHVLRSVLHPRQEAAISLTNAPSLLPCFPLSKEAKAHSGVFPPRSGADFPLDLRGN